MTDKEFYAEKKRREIACRKRVLENSISTLEQFIDYYRKNEDGHFFDPDTTRYFGTRYCYGKGIKKTPDGLYFMHSDKRCYEDYRRVYVIRWWSLSTGNFETVYKSMSRSEIERIWRDLDTSKDFDPIAQRFDTYKFDEENPVK